MKKDFHLVLIFLLFSTALVVGSVNPVAAAEGTIYIKSNGSVKPLTAPIQRVGNIYTFTESIYGSIIVEKDNVVIDGAGFTLQGTGANDERPSTLPFDPTQIINQSSIPVKPDKYTTPESNNTGIYSYAEKLTLMNLKITEFWCAIELEYSSDNYIIENEITNNTQGIWIHYSSNNTISNNNIRNNKQGLTLVTAHDNINSNNITDNSEYGIKLFWSFNHLSKNRIINNGYGVSFKDSTHNVFTNNIFDKNNRVFFTSSSSFQEYIQDVDNTNLVNGKPIYYWINKQDLSVPTDAGWVALVNCTHIRIEDLSLDSSQMILLVLTSDSTVINNIILHNEVGIYLEESTKNIITKNTIQNSYYGIQLVSSHDNNISHNNITNNDKGIYLDSSSKNIIIENDITRNNYGFELTKCTKNIISENIFMANFHSIHLRSILRTENMSDPINSTIIYRCSNNTFSKNNIINNNLGVWMSLTVNNTFFSNNFINNSDQIKIEDLNDFLVDIGIEENHPKFTSINLWHDNKEGNYWSNYEGTDNDANDIGDTPYIIDENNQDNFPLIDQWYPPTEKTEAFSATWIAAVIMIVAVVGAAFLVYLAKSKKTNKKAK